MSHGRAYFRAVFFLASFLTVFSSLAWAANPTLCSAGSATSAVCTNPTVISAADANAGPCSGASCEANPYQSSFTVSGLTGNVTLVTMTLNNVSQPGGPDGMCGAQLLLVAPSGTKLVVLNGVCDGSSAPPTTIQIRDAGANVGDCAGNPPSLFSDMKPTACGGANPTNLVNGFPTVCTFSPLTCPLAKPSGSGTPATA